MDTALQELMGGGDTTQQEASSASGSMWDELRGDSAPRKKEKPSEEPSMVGQFARNVGGTVAGIADVGLGLPAFAGAAGAALGDIPRVLTGKKRLTEVMGDVMDIASENSPSLGRSFPSLQQNPGYQAVGETMQPGKQVGRLMEAVGQGQDMPRLEAVGRGVQENVDPMLYAMGGVAGLGKAPLKPGSMAYYNELRNRPPTNAPGTSADARATYPPPMSGKEAVGVPGEDFQQPPHPAWAPDLTRTLAEGGMEFTEGDVGKRDIPEDPTLQAKGMRGPYFAPEMTEEGYAGSAQPRVPGPDNSLNWHRYDPGGVNALVEAEGKPGFLRDAIDKINMRFDRIRNMEDTNIEGKTKQEHEQALAKSGAEDATGAIDPIPIPARVQQVAEARIAQSSFAKYTEYLPVDQVWLMRDHNRLTDPKSDLQFVNKEASVLKNGLFEPLEITYSTADGKAVLSNGNTRASLAMKHGLNEIPVRVIVTDKPLSGTEAVNGVHIGKFDVKPGQAKPSDIGLMGRTPLNLGKFKQAGAVDFRGFMRETLDTQRVDESVRWDKRNVDPTTVMPDFYRRQPGEHPKLPGWAKKQYGMVDLSGFFGSKKKLTPEEILARIRKLSDIDNRPLSEAAAGIDASNIKDIDGTTHTTLSKDILGLLKTAGRQVMDARTIRTLLQNEPGVGPIISWVNKRIERLDRWGQNELSDVLYGRKLTQGRFDFRGFEHRYGSNDGMLSAMRSLKGVDKDAFTKEYDKQEGSENIAFDNPRHQKVYDTIKAGLDYLLEGANKERATRGLDAVPPRPGFMPRVREIGDYVVTAYDKGELVYHRSFSNSWKARIALGHLKDAKPELQWKDVEHKNASGAIHTDIEALVEARQANKNNPELVKALDNAIERGIQKSGAGGHFITRARNRISGYLGEEGSGKELERALSLYAEHMVNYTANLKRNNVKSEFEALRLNRPTPIEGAKGPWKTSKTGGRYQEDMSSQVSIQEVAPLFHDYMTKYMDRSRGQIEALDQLDKAAIEEIGRGLQMGSSFIQRSLYKLSNIATMVLLTKPSFFVSQPFQSLMSIPRMYELAHEFNIPTNVGTKPITSYLMGIMHSFLPATDTTGAGLRAGNWAIKEGYVDASLTHMLEAPSKYGGASKMFYGTMGIVEANAVRLPGLLAMEHFLRDAIPNETQRFEVASAQMFRTMAGTTKSNVPAIYTNIGPAGIPIRTMKSYQTNFYGQFAEYMDGALKEGVDNRLAPLGAFVATTALFGGIKGIVVEQEAEAIIMMVNYAFKTNFRTPQEWLLTGGPGDLMTALGSEKLGADFTGFVEKHPLVKKTLGFGLASTMLGHDIQAQVGNPSSFSLFSIIPLKVPLESIPKLWAYAKGVAQNQLTDSVRMEMWEAITAHHPMARGLIESMFQKPGRPVPRPYSNMAGNFYRDQPGKPQTQGYAEAILTGAKTIDESMGDALYNWVVGRERRLEQDRANTQHSIVDDIDNGNMEAAKGKMQDYVQKGGNADALVGAIKDTMTKRQITNMQAQQMHKGNITTQFAKKYQTIQPYLSADPALRELQGQPATINPGPQSSASGGMQLAADTSTSIPGVSGAPIPQQPPRPNMYQGDGIVRGTYPSLDTFTNPILSDTTPPSSWHTQQVPEPDIRYYGDKIDPYHNSHPGQDKPTESILGREGHMNWRPAPENRTQDKPIIERKRPPKTRSM